MIILLLINTSVYIMLSFLYIYSALISNKELTAFLPTYSDGSRAKSSITGSFITASVFGLFAFVTLGNLGLYDEYIEKDIVTYATIGIGIIFITRAIGNFNYLGFFKKQNGTQFAKYDSKFFSPLSLLLGLSSISIALLN